jgi:hypothetical protein
MGELYLDQIDRTLLQQYEESRSGNCLEAVKKVVDSLYTEHKIATRRCQVRPSPDGRFLTGCKR